MEMKLADDFGAVVRARPQSVRHRVVGVQAEEKVRINRKVDDLLPLRLVQTRQVFAPAFTVHAHRLDAVSESHRPAAIAGGRRDVVGAKVVKQPVQRRMEIRTVEAFVVVEDDQLPVRPHVIDDPAAESKVAHPPRREALGQIGKLCAQPRVRLLLPPLPPKMDEHVSVPHFAAGAVERIVLLRKSRRHVRRRQQASLDPVGPVVIRALDAIGEMAFGLLAQARSAVPTDVEQRVNISRAAARDDDALVAERAREEVAGVRNLIGTTGADPAVEIEALELGAIEIRVGVETPRQGGMHGVARESHRAISTSMIQPRHMPATVTAVPALRRALGRWDLTALGVNQVIGGAIFLWPAQVAAQVGAWSPIGYILIGLLSLSVALCFAELSSRFDSTGGPYLYTRSAFGEFVGFEIGWMQWFSRATSQASIMAATV